MRKKKAAALVLALLMGLSLAPARALASEEPSAAEAEEVVAPLPEDEGPPSQEPDGEIPAALDGDSEFVINGVTVTRTSSSITNNCYTYAQEIYKQIWGVGFAGYPGSRNDMLRNVTSLEGHKLTAENVKNYISAAALGSVIRLTNSTYVNSSSNGVGHSQILVQKDANGFTVLESNVTGGRREMYLTWEQYVRWWAVNTSNRGYFQYIEWPGAAAYDGPAPSEDCACSDSYAGFYTCTTTSSALNIRSGHGTSYASVGSIPPGEEVYVARSDGVWAHVEYNGITGYASMTYLKRADEAPRPVDPDGDGALTPRDAALCLESGQPLMAAMFLQYAVGL